MTDFKIGDKVRANAVFATIQALNGGEPDAFSQRALDGETMVVVRVDEPDSPLPFPIGAQFVEGEQYADWLADHMAYNPEELDHVED